MGYAPTKELLTSDDEVLHRCAVATCPEIVCEAGEVCDNHGDETICPSCKQPCEPYFQQKDWHTRGFWACDQCNTEMPCDC